MLKRKRAARLAALFRADFGAMTPREVEILRKAKDVFFRQGYSLGYKRASWLRGRDIA